MYAFPNLCSFLQKLPILALNFSFALHTCTVFHTKDVFEARQPSRPRPAIPQRPRTPQVDPKEQTVNEGDPAQFHCWIPGDPNVRLKWSKVHGAALPYGASDNGAGVLYIPRAQAPLADLYVCSAIDPRGGPPIESIPVELKVEPAGRKEHIRRRNFVCKFS